MKRFLLVITLLATNVFGSDLPTGSVQRATLSAKETAAEMALLGLSASSFDCTFDVPVYCRITFTFRTPSDPEPTVNSLATEEAAKTLRLNWCRLDAQNLASLLGVTRSAPPKTRYRFDLGMKSFELSSNAYPLEDGEQIGAHDLNPGQPMPLDTEIPLFSWAERVPGDKEETSLNVEEFARHDRYELATVRFSAKPIPPVLRHD